MAKSQTLEDIFASIYCNQCDVYADFDEARKLEQFKLDVHRWAKRQLQRAILEMYWQNSNQADNIKELIGDV